MTTIVLLIFSNIFMTFAWYGHLKFRYLPLWEVILVSWLIAFAEYCFQVPANRWGYGQFTAVELKTIQEVISLTIFSFFSVLYLGEQMRWNYIAGFALLAGGAYLIFRK
ncbi:MAG TPA: DMT family protein [Thermodesulfobacteriota bacterium]|nr:DMT family protein [Thermodesulfobacteriota bacterium]